jgi:hypothetical protein
MDIRIEHEPRPEDIRALEDRLVDFNVARTGIQDGKLVAAFLRDADGATIGGLFGWTWGGTCYIRYLGPVAQTGARLAPHARGRE